MRTHYKIILLVTFLLFQGSLTLCSTLKEEFTAKENAWLSSHKKIIVGGEVDWAPFDFVDKDGQYKGLSNDYLKIIAKELDLDIELITEPSWNNLIGMIRRKEIDILPAVYSSKEREKFLNLTTSYAQVTEFIFVRNNSTDISDMDDLKGKRVVIVKGYTIENDMRANFPEINLITASNIQESLKKVIIGEADAFIGDIASTSYNIKNYSLSGLKPIAPGPFPEPKVYMGVRNDWPELKSLINKVLANISQETHQKIHSYWLSMPDKQIDNNVQPSNGLADKETKQTADNLASEETSVLHLFLWFALFLFILLTLLALFTRLRNDILDKILKRRNLSYLGMIAIVIFITTVLLVTWFAMERMDRQLRAEIGNTLTTVNKSVKETMEMWLEGRSREIQHLSRDRELLPLTEQLLKLPRDAKTIQQSTTLKELRRLYQYHMDNMNAKGFFIIAPDRISMGSLRDTNIGTLNLIADQKKQLMDRVFAGETIFVPPIYSDVPLKNASGKMIKRAATMFFATPLYNSAKEVIAVLTLRFDPVIEFGRITQVGSMGSTSESYTFDRHARLLTKSRLGKQLSKLNTYFTSDSPLLSMGIRDPGGNLVEGYVPESERTQWPLTKMAKATLNGINGLDIEGYRDYRGVTVLGAWNWLEKLGIGLATEIDLSEAMEPYFVMRTLVLSATLGIIFIALLLTALAVWIGKIS